MISVLLNCNFKLITLSVSNILVPYYTVPDNILLNGPLVIPVGKVNNVGNWSLYTW